MASENYCPWEADVLRLSKQENLTELILRQGDLPLSSYAEQLGERINSFEKATSILLKHLPILSSNIELGSFNHQAHRAQLLKLPAKAAKLGYKNYLKQLCIYLHEITQLPEKTCYQYLINAENISNWKLHKPVCTVYKSDKTGLTIVELEIPQFELTDALRKKWNGIVDAAVKPLWFRSLPSWEQQALSQRIQSGRAAGLHIETIVAGLPTTKRKYPGSANYWKHVQLIYDAGGNLLDDSWHIRSGIYEPYDIPGNKAVDEQERLRLTKINIEQIILSHIKDCITRREALWGILPEGDPIHVAISLQTLLSPSSFDQSRFASTNSLKMIETKLLAASELLESQEFKNKLNELIGCSVELSLISNNHAINLYKTEWHKNSFYRLCSKERKQDNEQAKIAILTSCKYFLSSLSKQTIEDSYISKPVLSSAIENCVNALEKTDLADLDSQLSYLQSQYVILDRIDKTKLLVKTADTDPKKLAALKELKKLTNLHLISLALKHYLSLQNRSDNNGRHLILFLASYESLIVDLIGGIASGTCKSGKDRKAIELMHTDAMRQYFHCYNRLPTYYDTEEQRLDFCEIFAEIFLSRHHQTIAEQNTQGCAALKETYNTLPDDIKLAINQLIKRRKIVIPGFENIFDYETFVAKNNKTKISLSTKGQSIEQMIQKKLTAAENTVQTIQAEVTSSPQTARKLELTVKSEIQVITDLIKLLEQNAPHMNNATFKALNAGLNRVKNMFMRLAKTIGNILAKRNGFFKTRSNNKAKDTQDAPKISNHPRSKP